MRKFFLFLLPLSVVFLLRGGGFHSRVNLWIRGGPIHLRYVLNFSVGFVCRFFLVIRRRSNFIVQVSFRIRRVIDTAKTNFNIQSQNIKRQRIKGASLTRYRVELIPGEDFVLLGRRSLQRVQRRHFRLHLFRWRRPRRPLNCGSKEENNTLQLLFGRLSLASWISIWCRVHRFPNGDYCTRASERVNASKVLFECPSSERRPNNERERKRERERKPNEASFILLPAWVGGPRTLINLQVGRASACGFERWTVQSSPIGFVNEEPRFNFMYGSRTCKRIIWGKGWKG